MQVTSIKGQEIFMKYNLHIENKEEKYETENKITLEDITELFELQGVVGEKNLIKQLVCSSVNKSNFGLEGKSGSGKTLIMDKLIDILPNIYSLNQTSGVSTFYDSELINESQFLYIPELQKALLNKNRSIIEIIKDLSEGKNATRIRTNSSRTGITKQEINPNITIIYTLANENNFTPDKELSRRFIRFQTDNSEKHIEKILESQANERILTTTNIVKKENLKHKAKKYIKECINNNYKIIDPFSKDIFSQLPNINESITKAKNYSSIVDGYTKFYNQQHVKIKFRNQTYLITNLSDHQEINKIQNKPFEIKEEFIQNAKERVKEVTQDKFNEWFSKQII